MLGVPEKYRIRKKFDTKTFLTADLTVKEKKRFKDAVQAVTLEYQIAGEEIPSIINEEYNCQAVLYFDVKLNELKNSSFVGEIMQKMIKPPALIRFRDDRGMFVYCLAHKRLNMQNKEDIVVEDVVFSPPASMFLPDETGRLMAEYIEYENVKNKTNKLTFYYEMLTKMILISSMNLWSGARLALDSNLYYDIDKSMYMAELLKKLKQLERKLKSEVTISEKAKINGEIKAIIVTLNDLIKQ